MNIAFYSGVSGLVAFQQDLDNLSHNMANVNTNGYKATRTNFSDLLYTQMDVNKEDKPLTGHGVKAADLDLMYSQGTPVSTNNQLDFALIGDGFFAVERGDHTEYTRNGAFRISVEGKNGYLVSSDGGYILDAKGKRIKLDRENKNSPLNLDSVREKIGVYQFENPYGLQQTENSCFLETATSGEAKALNAKKNAELPYNLVQNALESSNVDLAQEMVDVIITQKAFQFSAKMVQTADSVEEIVNNLR